MMAIKATLFPSILEIVSLGNYWVSLHFINLWILLSFSFSFAFSFMCVSVCVYFIILLSLHCVYINCAATCYLDALLPIWMVFFECGLKLSDCMFS
jgi:hypothetical protein